MQDDAEESIHETFDAVPQEDFFRALSGTMSQWNSASDWKGDERNIVLTLARIWYSASTGQIAPKDVAAAWVLERLPDEHRAVVCEAREAYLGTKEDRWEACMAQTTAFIGHAKSAIERILPESWTPLH